MHDIFPGLNIFRCLTVNRSHCFCWDILNLLTCLNELPIQVAYFVLVDILNKVFV